MANVIYPKFKTARGQGAANVSLNVNDATNGVFVALVDAAVYTYSAAHEFYSSLSGIIGTDQRIVNNTFGTVADGVLDGDDVSFTAVTGASVEALVFYRKNAGANTTWRLIAYIDTGQTNLPVTPNGGNIAIAWNASGILLT